MQFQAFIEGRRLSLGRAALTKFLICSLVAQALFLTACSDKSLFGLSLGMPLAKVEVAFHPVSGSGAWSAGAKGKDGTSVKIWRGETALPSQVRVYAQGGSVTAIYLRASKEGLDASAENPITYPERFRKVQVPADATGPVDHLGFLAYMDPTRILEFEKDAEGFSVGRVSLQSLDLASADCVAAIKEMPGALEDLEASFGADGLRDAKRRALVLQTLRSRFAGLELACPEGAGVLTASAQFHALTGDPAGAKARFLLALKKEGLWGSLDRSDALGGLGALALRFGLESKAAKHYRLAISSAASAPKRAKIARAYGDALHKRERYTQAGKQYALFLENTDTKDPDVLTRVYARLVRSVIEAPKGCAKAKPFAETGLALEGAGARARGAMLAAEAFRLIACEPRAKRKGYAKLKEAVALDPLMAAEWSRLTAYYDREAQDATVLKIMLDQGWLDRKGIAAARSYQRELRGETR